MFFNPLLFRSDFDDDNLQENKKEERIMKRLLIILFTIFLSIPVITGCSSETRPIVVQTPIQETDEHLIFNVKDFVYFEQSGTPAMYFFRNCGFLDTWDEYKRIPLEKRQTLFENIGISPSSQDYPLSDILDITVTPNSLVKKGDTIVFRVVVKEGMNLTLEQIEEQLNVEFVDFDYTVEY